MEGCGWVACTLESVFWHQNKHGPERLDAPAAEFEPCGLDFIAVERREGPTMHGPSAILSGKGFPLAEKKRAGLEPLPFRRVPGGWWWWTGMHLDAEFRGRLTSGS